MAENFVRHTIQESELPSASVVEEVKTEAFRPRRRPPMALLSVVADGGETESDLPVFKSPFVIGRLDADFTVDHDPSVSKRHVSLTRRQGRDGREVWYLEDMGSRNGLYVRAVRALLGHGEELLLGSKRFRVVDRNAATNRGTISDDSGVVAEPDVADTYDQDAETHGPQVELVEIVDSKPIGEAFRLEEKNQWIGRNDRLCTIVLDDPMISPRHAMLRPQKQGKWTIADARSLNGVWIRVKAIPLSDAQPCQFQIGEQRFVVRIP